MTLARQQEHIEALVVADKGINNAESTTGVYVLVDIAEIVLTDIGVESLERVVFLSLLAYVNYCLVKALEREKGSQYERDRGSYCDEAESKAETDLLIHIIIAF